MADPTCSDIMDGYGGIWSDESVLARAFLECSSRAGCDCANLEASSTCHPPTPEVTCGVETCSSGSFCCEGWGCLSAGEECPTTHIFCDGPEDCAEGSFCCGQSDGQGTDYSILECRAVAAGCNWMCHVGQAAEECARGEDCIQSTLLPGGYGYCAEP